MLKKITKYKETEKMQAKTEVQVKLARHVSLSYILNK